MKDEYLSIMHNQADGMFYVQQDGETAGKYNTLAEAQAKLKSLQTVDKVTATPVADTPGQGKYRNLFENLKKKARFNEKLTEEASAADRAAYMAIRSLYVLHAKDEISIENAKKEIKRIYAEWAVTTKEQEQMNAIFGRQQIYAAAGYEAKKNIGEFRFDTTRTKEENLLEYINLLFVLTESMLGEPVTTKVWKRKLEEQMNRHKSGEEAADEGAGKKVKSADGGAGKKVKSADGGAGRYEKENVFKEFAGENKELLAALKDFEKMRNKAKKPMTERAKKMLVNKLNNKCSPERYVAVLEESINHCWADIYPEKDTAAAPKDKGRKASFDLDKLKKQIIQGPPEG